MTTNSHQENKRESINIVIAGHVDHGKSTIIGRLLADTKSLPDGKLDFVKETCRRNARPFEYAFLLDALKNEQSQGITIDAARCFFKTAKRNYIIIDAPGHIEFIKNMITGAARAEAALLVIDADEGIQENSRRHGYLLSLLGIKQVAVLVNKMDLADYSPKTFTEIKNGYNTFLNTIGIFPTAYIPTSGMLGDNIARHSSRMPWYEDLTVLELLDAFKGQQQPKDKPFRMPVQDIYKFTENGDTRRIIAGTVSAGILHTGDIVTFYPSGKTSMIKTIETFSENKKDSVGPGYAAGFTLADQIYVTRGELAAINNQAKPLIAARLKTNLFWLGKEPMRKNQEYLFKLGTAKVSAFLEEIIHIIDASTLEYTKKDKIDKHDVAECIIRLTRDIACDLSEDLIHTSRFAIVDNYEISGGGIIREVLQNRENESAHKTAQPSQKGITLWFTGLSGAGKTTVAQRVEELLKNQGFRVERLDGDIVRQHISRDLGFSKEDRDANISRNSFVASLLTQNGVITLCCFISPYRRTREDARKRIGTFIEVYVNAPLDVCRKRDVKGLYAKADSGEIPQFTGITAPYEAPLNPDIELRTDQETIEESAYKVIRYLKDHHYIQSGYADLHLHTTASDGTTTPGRLVQNAREAGFSVIAITDHDTTEGIKEAQTAGKIHKLEVISGIELSALDGEKEVHILGYFIDPNHPQLINVIGKIKEHRKNRAVNIVRKLNKLGLNISLERVRQLAENDVIGRPHIARAMQEKGIIKEIKEAFSSEYFGRDGKAYVERYKITPPEAITLIQQAGGIAVLAHPGYLSDRTSLSEETIAKYAASGLQGLEVYYSRHTLMQINYYYDIAQKYNLLITGGSDSHGSTEPMLGSVRLPLKYIQTLKHYTNRLRKK